MINSIRFPQLTEPETKDTFIYESPDGGKTIYRRKFMDYSSPRECIKNNNKMTILELLNNIESDSNKIKKILSEYTLQPPIL